VYRGAARSLLVTPWFAAGTGFVIATALWIYSPHTELRFPEAAPGLSQCPSRGCVSDSPRDGGGQVAASVPGEKIDGSQAKDGGRTGKSDIVTNAAAAGLKFKFTILWQNGQHFGAYITVSGHSVPSSWRLSFAIPGVRIDYVTGVSWRSDADRDGGTASPQTWPGNGAVGNGGGGNGASQGTSAENDAGHNGFPVISFSVMGTGSVGPPTTCRFDGSTCSFR
jgi:hypothetical protein